ncbi:hypothetical protein GCM10010413_52880 [Promicromonospora sukumoe]|uniref:Uncharacterized protein n=1 Tax=Promicromonospora sukumoe TaxID=88382 RepID=A0A7W3PG75_9MICO|nr:hypothetical protein [Promicromonospora sukumoe]MBA8810491.1 hypothetical protein [Promicromonospora sukumoe]
MSAATSVAASPARDTLVREAERRAARRAAGVTVRVVATIGAWYWAIFAVIAVAVVLGTVRWGSGMDQGVVDAQLGGSSRWFVLVLGLIIPATYLRLHVAAGGTRRSMTTGTVRGALVSGLLIGAVTALYLVGERALFGALDLTWAREFGLPVGGYGGIALTVVSEALVAATYYLVGATIAAGYYRLGVVRGSLYILVALVPAALVDLASRTGVTALVLGPESLPDGAAGVLLGLAAGAAAVALAAWLFSAPLRSVPLRPAV